MENLIRILYRYHFFILFFVFEVVCLQIVLKGNDEKNAKFTNTTNAVTGFIYKHFNLLNEYLSLRTMNDQLAEENAKYRNLLKSSYYENKVTKKEIVDSVYRHKYTYFAARVINNSVSKQFNYLTLDKGAKQGIKPDMAVVSSNGVVGIVMDVSDNFSSVISILNRKLGVSAKIKKNDYFGSIVWDGVDYKTVKLEEIPDHIKVFPGDTVVTSGYSVIFPEGIYIGVITVVNEKKEGNFWDITVKLSTDFKRISNVYVIGNLLKLEQVNLEKATNND